MNTVDQKIAQRGRAWDKLTALRAKVGNHPCSPAERAQWDQLDAEIVSLGAEIDESRGTRPLTAEDVRYAAAFASYARRGIAGTTPDEQRLLAEHRAQAEGTNSAGGYLVPQGYWLKITETQKAFGGLMAAANTIRTTTGQPLPWPSNDDTANVGGLLSENVQIAEVDLTLGDRMLGAYTYTSGSIIASNELLQDSAFDLDTWLPTKMGTRIGRGVAADLVTGSGLGRPLGIATAVRTGVTGAAGQTASVSYGALVDLVHSVDPAYRQSATCSFLLNDVTAGVLRKLVDTTGRPLWSPSMVQGLTGPEPDTFLGYPLVIDNAMPIMAAGARSIIFGDFHAGYVVRQVKDVTVLRLVERYADSNQTGWVAFARFDGAIDDAAAVAAYVNAAA